MLCWIWTGVTDATGTPIVRTAKSSTTARRHYYEREIGPVPAHHVLIPLCGHRLCIRPRHAQPVTRAQFSRLTRGVLDRKMAETVKVARRKGQSLRQIAKAFGVDESVIRAVESGEHWTQRKELA